MKKYQLRDYNVSGLTVGISRKHLLHDPSESYQKLVNELTSEAINPTINYEVIRYRPVLYVDVNIDYYLLNANQMPSLDYDGIIETPVNTKTFVKNKFNKSFFTLDYYTTPKTDTQVLVDRTILNTYNGISNSGLYQSRFNLRNLANSGYGINIPKRLFDDGSIANNRIYLKSRWFNAAKGSIGILKKNSSSSNYITFNEEELYYEIELLADNSWRFTNPVTTSLQTLDVGIEFYEFTMD